MIVKKEKKKIVLKYGSNIKNSGETAVQIALLTYRINRLKEHFKKNKKDHSTRKGLLNMVAKRRKLLFYLKEQNFLDYSKLVEKLKLRK